MPKSKRNKNVDLTKTRKHGMDLKKRLYEEIRSCIDDYTNIFVFSVTDMRNTKLKSVREQWRHSRFFFGKNKVMALAFGCSPEDEYRTNLHKIGNRLKGQCGLLFSNKSKDEVLKWFDSYSEADFARSGNPATENVTLREGPLPQFTHSLEPNLRSLGMPTTLKKGVIHLVKDYEVCKIGDKLTPESARILKLMGYEMAEFHFNIECVWSKDGEFEDLNCEPFPEIKLTEKKDNFSLTPMDDKSEDDDDDNDDMDMCETKTDNLTPTLNNLNDFASLSKKKSQNSSVDKEEIIRSTTVNENDVDSEEEVIQSTTVNEKDVDSEEEIIKSKTKNEDDEDNDSDNSAELTKNDNTI